MNHELVPVFTFATPFTKRLWRYGEFETPIIAKCLHSRVSKDPGDVFSAKLVVEMLSGSGENDKLAAWDVFHVFATARMSNIEDGWCIFNFDSFDGKPAELHLDCPKEEFRFRVVAEFYTMRERKGVDLDVSVKEKGKMEHIGNCVSPEIEVVN